MISSCCGATMTTSTALLALALLATAAAAPWGGDSTPRCSTECAITGSPKLAYIPGKTYSYSYSGKSQIRLKGVDGGVSETDWSSRVELTWISPCDMAITLKEPKVDNGQEPAAGRFLEKYPLVVALHDGQVQHVCSHPDDDAWAINMKKGVATAFQNSLPSNASTHNFPLMITEKDVVGKCPTKYETEIEGEKVIVRKEKNHTACHERYPTPDETPVPWMKGPLPVQDSKSMCRQEITKGIYTTITCEDKSIVRPSYGAYKYIEARQESKLQFQSESPAASSSISSTVQGQMVRKSLLYDHKPLNKDQSLVPQLDQTMTQICEKTKEAVEHDVAPLVAKAVHLLRRVPEDAVEQTLEKIRGGRFCSDYKKLESIFLDAVAFVHESGAAKVIVKELVNGHVTTGRKALYTAALFLTPQPCIHAIEALKPLMEASQRLPSAALAGASMVNAYCRHNRRCEREEPVRRIIETLSNKLGSQCSSSQDEETRKAALVTLKALGNIGVMTPEVASSTIRCIETQGADTGVRVAAAQAFRNAKCLRQSTVALVNKVVDPTLETEVRIASYLASVRCAHKEDLNKIIHRISREENTQVRGFILSHLLNTQESDSPQKAHLRYLLADVVIPVDFDSDFRKFSRNIEMSYFAPSFGVGAGFESDVIYTPGSFIPRSLTLNLTTALQGTIMSLGEIGARFEGLEEITEELFGPEGYFHKSSFGKIFEDLSTFAEEESSKIAEHFKESLRLRRSISFSSISEFFNKLYRGDRTMKPRADIFARFMGQEISFASLSGDPRDFSADRLIDTFFSYFDEVLSEMKNLNIDSARTAQFSLDYSLPSIQGIPLKLQFEGTAVVGLKLKGKLDILQMMSDFRNTDSKVEIVPSLSIAGNGFVGYNSFLMKAGLETKNNISSSTGLSVTVKAKNDKELVLELNLPDKIELIEVKSEVFLVKSVRGKPDTKIHPSSRDVRVRGQSCTQSLENALGLKVCYDYNVPNVIHSESLPLGAPSFAKLYIEKSESSLKGYVMNAAINNNERVKSVKAKLGLVGVSPQREAEILVSYTKEQDSHKISAALESSTLSTEVALNVVNQEDQKAIEAFLKFRSSATEISRGIKVDFKRRSSSTEQEYEVGVYTGRSKSFSPESQIVEAKFSKKDNGQEVNVDIQARTKNVLRSYVDLNFEAGTDLMYTQYSRVPVPFRLRKLELHTSIGRVQVTSFIRKTSESGESSVHESAFILKLRGEDLVSVQANHNIEGSWKRDFAIKSAVTVKVGRTTYKVSYDIHRDNTKKGAAVQVVRSSDSVRMVDFEVYYLPSQQQFRTKVLVDVPEWMSPIKFDTNIRHESERYMVDSAFRHGQRMIVQLTGPVTAKFSSKVAQVESDLQLTTLASEPHKITTTFVFGSNKQIFAFELKKQQEQVFDVEWKMDTQTSQESKIGIKLLLPSLIDTNADAIINERLIHVSFNSLVSPKSSSPRRIKGFADVDLQNKKSKMNLAWDADRDASKKLNAEATLIISPSNPGLASIHGNVVYKGETYHTRLELTVPDRHSYSEWENGFTLEVTTPSQKTFVVDTKLKVEEQQSNSKVDIHIRYKNLENKEYKFTSAIALEKLGSPYSYKLESQTSFKPPEGQERTLQLEAKHLNTSAQREVHFKTVLSTPTLQKPMEIEILMNNRENSYSTHWKVDIDRPRNIIVWNVETYPEGGIKTFDTSMDASAALSLSKTIHKLISPQGTEDYNEVESYGQRSRYGVQYHKPGPNTYNVVVESPSRTMEGEVHYSPSEGSIKVYPRRDQSETKYEAAVRVTEPGPYGGESKIEGRLSHPSMSKDIQMSVQYSSDEQKMQGRFELDIFPDTQDKITGTLESSKISRDSVKVEASLTSRILKSQPKLVITTAYAPSTVGFDVKFQRTPSSVPSFVLSAKYENTTSRDAAFALIVKTENGPVMDISGSVEPKETHECYGMKMRAIAWSSVTGSYDIHSQMCRPVFVEVITNKHNSQKEYITKIGLQSPVNAEFSVREADKYSQEEKAIIMSRINLVSPRRINFETAYKSEEASVLKESIKDEWERLSSSVSSWVRKVNRYIEDEAQENHVQYPSSELVKVLKEIQEEWVRIYEDLSHDLNTLSYEVLPEILENPTVSNMISVLRNIGSGLVHAERRLRSGLVEGIRTWQEEFKGLADLIKNGVMRIARVVETGELPDFIYRLLEDLEQTTIYRKVKREVDTLLEEYPEAYQAIKEVLGKVWTTLGRDLDYERERIMEISAVRRIVLWIMRHFNSEYFVSREAENMAKYILQKVIFFSVETEPHYMKIEVPLYRPLYSLSQVAKEVTPNITTAVQNLIWAYDSHMPVPVDNLIWAYYTFLPRNLTDLMPPFNRTAMVVGDTEILTFDGAVLRAPRSPCKVLLAAYKSTKLIMSHPQPSAPAEITLAAPSTTVAIKPDYRVMINGREMSGSEQTEGQVKVQKSPYFITVTTPIMRVNVSQKARVVSVQVSGWTYGRIAGLLGTYDGEVGNDRFMPSGRKASNLQELVASWQEDRQCSTPAISPVDPKEVSVARAVQCHTLVGIRSRCRPLVRPESFVQMCYGSRDAYDAASAYRTICSTKGVEIWIPFAEAS